MNDSGAPTAPLVDGQEGPSDSGGAGAAAEGRPSTVGSERTLAEMYTQIGLGFFQWRLFFIAGLGFMADSMEVGVITFLSSEAEKVFHVEGYEKNALALIVFAGEFLGCFVWGPLSDRVGRKKAFVASNVMLLTFGALSAAAPNFWTLVALRGLVGIAIGGIVVPFDILLESVESEEHKNMLGYAMEFWWTAGTLFVTGLAAVVLPAEWGGWRLFVLLTGFPILMVCIGAFWVDESPTWLVDVGCNDEALVVLQRMAKTNGKDITGLTLLPYEREAEPSMKELFAPKLRRRTLSLAMLWCLGLFGYYGASLANEFIFDSASGFNYTAIFFSASGEIVGVILNLVLSNYVGGMVVLGICYQIAALGSVGILILKLLPNDAAPKVLLALCAFVLRLGAMGGSSAVWVVTPPAYPTHVRSTAHSLLFGAGRIGGLMATLWPPDTPVPIIMGAYAIANGLCSIIGFTEGRALEGKGAFETLQDDLHATNIERRARSVQYRSTRLSTGTTGRPSLFGSNRLSTGAGRQSNPTPLIQVGSQLESQGAGAREVPARDMP